jgi:two-component system, cell cycle response regulator DivK
MSHTRSLEKTVLLVEDEESARYIFGTILEHAGYRTLKARDAAAGFRILDADQPDLIIMDLGLPGEVDGFRMTEMLREDPRTRDVPIVVVTVFAFEHDEQRARAAGCTSFLAKPVQPSEIVAEVRRLIGPAGAAVPAG